MLFGAVTPVELFPYIPDFVLLVIMLLWLSVVAVLVAVFEAVCVDC